MRRFIAVFCVLLSYGASCQTIQIDTKNNNLNLDRLRLERSTYLVYFQNGPNAPKYNIEVWDRDIRQTVENTYTISWVRQNYKEVHRYSIRVGQGFQPISEEIIVNGLGESRKDELRKYYHFKDDKVFTDNDTVKHNQAPFTMENTALAFNWELDLEILGMLPFEDYKQFDINFYHPGSKSKPEYHTYQKVREEKLSINDQEFSCWVLKIDHNENQWSEFWIDKQTRKVLLMRDFFYGRFRYKKLVI